MSHLMTDLPAVAVTDIAAALKEKIEEQLESARTDQAAFRAAVRVDSSAGMSLLNWLGAQPDATTGRLYWRDRARRFECAALGVADLIASIDGDPIDVVTEVHRRLQQLPDTMRYYGGFRFGTRNDTTPMEWSAVPSARFHLPRFEFVRYHNTLLFACNLLPGDLAPEALAPIVEQLRTLSFASNAVESPTPRLRSRTDSPDYERWQSMVIEADEQLQVGELQKVVLARRSELEFDQPLSGWRLLEQLEPGSDGCFLFGVEFDHGPLFFGSTPERLYHREGVRLQTEAIAGTRARAESAEADTMRIAELKDSAKDSLEHQLVVDGILEALDSLGISHKKDPEISVLTLSRLHHLACRILGKLSDGVSDPDLLAALHPTPAVGGMPRANAIGLIAALEPFDRGWYAGPIGWLGKDAAEFAVAIRSALTVRDKLYLYAGAGIVPGSDPDSEWQEIESKIARYISLLAE